MTTPSEALSGLDPLLGWLETLTATRWTLLAADAAEGELVEANGQPVARLTPQDPACAADTAAAAALLSWAADRVLTVKDLTRQSARLWQELGFFHRISGKLDALLHPEDGLPVLLESLTKLLRSRAGWLHTWEGPAERAWSVGDRPAPPALRKLAEAARASGSALAVSQAAHMPETLSASEREALLAFMPIVIAPVQVQGALVGAVAVGAPITPGPYMSFAAKLLYGGTAMANGLLLRARMIAEAESAASLRREMEVARRIQQSLRPRAPLALPTVSAWGWCREATMVGGDMYGWWTPESAHQPVWCYIGDVSGHGVGPALLMSNAYAVLRALCREEATASAVADRLNALLCEDIEQAMEYLTLSLMRIDPVAGELHYVGLGHPPVLLLRAGEDAPVWLEGDGLPAGLFSGETYQSATVKLQPGDLLVAYTDGITERELSDGEAFGPEGLAAFMAARRDAPLADIGHALVSELEGDGAGEAPSDDQTLLLVRIGAIGDATAC